MFKSSVTKQILLLLFIGHHSCRNTIQLNHVLNQVNLKPKEKEFDLS